ncbi:hypothetical protein HYC85_015382 [Camellia sinensis]|uniref:Uncharacterized protein n=1 Tax=Camellia sinensis TaxID=4442 RepID=A0A7J7H090_CAMSI|nr:hypothetical protein HYC85_015382 [Camellia sinensis]
MKKELFKGIYKQKGGSPCLEKKQNKKSHKTKVINNINRTHEKARWPLSPTPTATTILPY